MKPLLVKVSMIWMILMCGVFSCHSQDTLKFKSYSKKAGVGYSVCVDKDYAYITNNDGVVVFDVHQPRRPQKVGTIRTGVTFGICVKQGLAYISGESGLLIADVRDPSNPQKLSEYAIKDETHAVRVDGPYAFVTGNRGLEILDVRDPDTILHLAHYGDDRAWGVEVRDGIAYLASDAHGVEVIDVTDPASPKKIGVVDSAKGAWDVHVHDEYLCSVQ